MIAMEFLGYAASLLMGLALGLMGGGGSILTVPILVYFFGFNGMEATTGSLFIVGLCALIGTIVNLKRGLIDWKTGFIFAAPSFFGVYISRKILLPWVPESVHLTSSITLPKSTLLLSLFAILMIFSSRAMIRPAQNVSVDLQKGPSFFITALVGFLVGGITGFVGAGGGFLIVPALAMLLHIPMHIAVGTSLAIISFNSLFGFSVGLGDQTIQWRVVLIIVALGVGGMFLGLKMSPHIQEKKLKTIFGYFILVLGVSILGELISKII